MNLTLFTFSKSTLVATLYLGFFISDRLKVWVTVGFGLRQSRTDWDESVELLNYLAVFR